MKRMNEEEKWYSNRQIKAVEIVCKSLISGFEVKWKQEMRKIAVEWWREDEKRKTDTG